VPQNTTPQSDTSAPMPPMIEISKLAVGTILMVETEMYLYRIDIHSPRFQIVNVETGDKEVEPTGKGGFARLAQIQKGQPICFEGAVMQTAPVAHVEVSGVNEQGPWSYEVF